MQPYDAILLTADLAARTELTSLDVTCNNLGAAGCAMLRAALKDKEAAGFHLKLHGE